MIEGYDKEFVLDCAPVYTLNEILPLKPDSDLRKICMFSHIEGLNEMSKDELVEAAYNVCTDESEFRNILLGMEVKMWEFLEELTNEKYIKYDEPFPDDFYNMRFFGIVQIFHYEDNQYLVVPEEIRKMYKTIAKNEFTDEKKHFMNLESYAKASANFYRIISNKELADIYNSQNEDKTDEDDIYDVLIEHYFSGKGYCLMKTHIVNEEYEGIELSELEKFERETADIPRFIPDKDEFLRYKDEDYYEETQEVKDFREFINDICDNKISASDFVEDLIRNIRNEEDPKYYFRLLELYDIELEYSDIDEFGRNILRLIKNMRFWSKKGHTPDEISIIKREKSNLRVIKGDSKEKLVFKMRKSK
ncbi:MAG: hypothetical protein FWC47_13865 [Oscillospiraceae bacterium]|nr:hypothetical protein [Oscillospiraceae bacterium]